MWLVLEPKLYSAKTQRVKPSIDILGLSLVEGPIFIAQKVDPRIQK
jgi:hypothetical protein